MSRYGSSVPAKGRACWRVPAGVGIGIPFGYRNLGDLLTWARSPRQRLQTRALLGHAATIAALRPGTVHPFVAELGVDAGQVRIIPIGADPVRSAGDGGGARFGPSATIA